MRVKIDEFKEYLPIINTLGNPGLKERHWQEISDIVGVDIIPSPKLTLAKVLDMKLEAYVSRFASISEAATKENNIEKLLNKLISEWDNQNFTVHPYR